MNDNALVALAGALSSGRIETVDLTHTLDPDFPVIVLPPEFGQCARFRVEEVSRYDERGPAWYWRNFTCSEHTGTHFDAPIHWISGKDLPDSSVDSIPADAFVRPVCVIDCSKESTEDEDFLLTTDFIQAWEGDHGAIPEGAWVLMRTDWSKRSGAEYLNMREDGAHTPGPTGDAIRYLVLQSMAWKAQGDTGAALSSLTQALAQAEPEGVNEKDRRQQAGPMRDDAALGGPHHRRHDQDNDEDGNEG